jgi:SHS2 domain-containing protein
MNKDFEFLDHTADAGIIAYGDDLKGAFSNAARGMFSLIADLKDFSETEERDTELDSPDVENLLIAWLNELIYLFDVENIVFKNFEIVTLSDTHIEAKNFGEKVDASRHKLKLGIKAATYHMLKIDKLGNKTRVQVLFDI